MAKIRKVLKDVSVETAQRQRVCHRNRKKHQIRMGQPCLVIRDPATLSSKNYCIRWGQEILKKAREDLAALAAQLPT